MKRVGFLIALAGLWLAPMAQAQSVLEVRAKGSFEEVKQLLVIAIEGQGLVVDHVATVGEMLERTGQDLGATTKIYERAEVLQFCSANYSRQMMGADPAAAGVLPVWSRHLHAAGRNRIPCIWSTGACTAEGVGPAALEALAKIDARARRDPEGRPVG